MKNENWLAYPDATIVLLDDGIRKIAYEETDHFLVTRDFLNRRKKMLEELMS